MAEPAGTGRSDPSALVASVRAHPARTLLALDYDGSLAPIVDDPATAMPLAGSADVLVRLSQHLGRVLVVSGRPLSFLTAHLPTEVDIAALYGLEGIEHGERWEHPEAAEWRAVITEVAEHAFAAELHGVRVESKGLSLTLHFREHPDIEERVAAFAEGESVASRLAIRHARMSIEIHPPVDVDKGSVIAAAGADAAVVVFAGDDVGDLPAFDALDVLAAAGATCWRITVRSTEAPAALLARADLVVDGPEELLDLLRQLAESIPIDAS